MRIGAFVLSFIMALGIVDGPAVFFGGGSVYGQETAEVPSTTAGQTANATSLVYNDYLNQYAGVPLPEDSVEVDIFTMTDSLNAEKIDNYEGYPAVLSAEDGFVEWAVDIAQEGLYNIYLEYYPVESRGVDIERRLLLNGEMPFVGADTLTFTRVWTDAGPVRQDNRGNDIRPSQAEAPRWEFEYLRDALGYFTEPYLFYFHAGVNTIRLEAISEPIAIRRLLVQNEPEPPTYSEMLRQNAYGDAPSGYLDIVEGETAQYRSSPTLYATYDRSSPGTEPYSVDKTVMNMMGGIQWRVAGQWIEWAIDVPEDGNYHLSFKSRQNLRRGNVSVREMTIDGEVPFQEVREINFAYTGDWVLNTLCDGDGKPYLFPLSKGKHVIRLEVAMGAMGEYLNDAEQAVIRLTAAYRKILVLVGTSPDGNRDYQVDKVYPEVMEYFTEEIKTLDKLVADVTAYTGQRGAQVAVAGTISKKLTRFLKNPEIIPRSMAGLKIDLGSLADFVLRMSESPLDIDYIVVSAPDAKLPKMNTGFVARVAHEVRSFLVSFYVDYNSIGSVFDENIEPLEVWMLSGRDQAQSLKTIIDDTFTAQYGIAVNIRLVTANVLLPAVVAGTGPDIALQVANSEPVNFALRNAAVDLSKLPGFDEVKSEFFDSSFVPYKFNGGIYGLPETQGFPVLFYREDILRDLGIEVPSTWADVIKALPVLQKNNLDFGLATDDLLSMYGAFLNMLYQRGGSVYTEDGSRTLLDNNLSVDAFESFTTMYTHYKLPKIYTFADRFRTGEMPMGIADYTLFNQLSVSAPEIRGLWNFTAMPGYVDADGNINRSVSGGGVCSMLLPSASNRENAWTFLRWWISSDTQARFGRELESIIGAAARYNTANVNAFKKLSWSNVQRKVILEQWAWVVGTPEMPGGYYTSRHTLNALRKVMNKNEEPRETLLDYGRVINEELEKKRKEFGLGD